MFHLTREVRFAVNQETDRLWDGPPTNNFAGYPSLTGVGHYFSLAVTLAGQTQPRTGCLLNIKDVDAVVRARVIPSVWQSVRHGRGGGGGAMLIQIFRALQGVFEGLSLERVELALTPFQSL